MGFETTGRLYALSPTKQVSERFQKREFVVEIADGKYPQFVLFQLTGDRCAQLDEHRVGDSVRVTFNLRGREWRSPQGETKYFNSLDVWKLESAQAATGARRGRGPSQGDDMPVFQRDEPRPIDLGVTRDDDLPF